MYAIVEIAGQQFKVEKDRTVYTHRLAGEEGAALVFDKVLLVDKGGDVTVGAPTLAGAKNHRKNCCTRSWRKSFGLQKET